MIEVRNVPLAICQAVSYWSFAAHVRVQYQGSPYEICGGRSYTGQSLLRVLWVFPSQYYSTSAHI